MMKYDVYHADGGPGNPGRYEVHPEDWTPHHRSYTLVAWDLEREEADRLSMSRRALEEWRERRRP
jgi:hypothetical protein